MCNCGLLSVFIITGMSQLSQRLPRDVQDVVSDMVCHYQHNDHESAHGVVIVISVDRPIDGVLNALSLAVFTTLKCAHKAADPSRSWCYVENVRGEGRPTRDMYQICLHLGDTYQTSALPLFPYSYLGGALHPTALMPHFRGTMPPFVCGVAISCVCEATIRDEWSACIAKDTDTFDRPGLGYMIHPMVVLPEDWNGDQDGVTVREQSCNFGWVEYPGDRGEGW